MCFSLVVVYGLGLYLGVRVCLIRFLYVYMVCGYLKVICLGGFIYSVSVYYIFIN